MRSEVLTELGRSGAPGTMGDISTPAYSDGARWGFLEAVCRINMDEIEQG